MTKKGRPKNKDRERYPSGQVKPESAGITHNQLQRLRALSTNPLLETQIGRLLFLEELRPIDAQTGFRIAEIYGRYDRSIGRRRSVRSPSYEVGRGRDSGGDENDSQRSRAQAAARAFAALQAEIKLCPRGVKAAMEELCVEDRPCPPGWLPAVKIALDMLAVPLGIRGMRRNTKQSKPQPTGQQQVFSAVSRNLADLDEETSATLYEHFKSLFEEEKFQRARRDRERFQREGGTVLTPKNRKE